MKKLLGVGLAVLSTGAYGQPRVPHMDEFCGLPPEMVARTQALVTQAITTHDRALAAGLTGLLEGWNQSCHERYEAAMGEWRAEMLRWQLTR